MEKDGASLVFLYRTHVVLNHCGIFVGIVITPQVFEIVGLRLLCRHLIVKRVLGIADPVVFRRHHHIGPLQLDVRLVAESKPHRIGPGRRSHVPFALLPKRSDSGPSDIRVDHRCRLKPPPSFVLLIASKLAQHPIGTVIIDQNQLPTTIRQPNLLILKTCNKRIRIVCLAIMFNIVSDPRNPFLDRYLQLRRSPFDRLSIALLRTTQSHRITTPHATQALVYGSEHQIAPRSPGSTPLFHETVDLLHALLGHLPKSNRPQTRIVCACRLVPLTRFFAHIHPDQRIGSLGQCQTNGPSDRDHRLLQRIFHNRANSPVERIDPVHHAVANTQRIALRSLQTDVPKITAEPTTHAPFQASQTTVS